MSARRLHIAIIAIFALLFISLQSFALSHGAAYGDGPHEHDGVICDISLVTSDDQAIEPELPVFDRPENTLATASFAVYRSADNITPPAQAPPPRAPPHLTA